MNILEFDSAPTALIGRGSRNGTLRELKAAINKYSREHDESPHLSNWRHDYSSDAVQRRGRKLVRPATREAEG